MPAPLVLVAKKVGVEAVKQIHKRSPGGIYGFVIIGSVLSLVMSFGVIGSIVGAFTSAAGGAAAAACQGSITPITNPAALADIPAPALDAYVNAAQATGLDWTYIAGIGEEESHHGRSNGAHIEANGDVMPPIFGPPLDGTNGNELKLNPDGSYARAEGPMQFMSDTWAGAGKDGNGDGKADPNNIYDAALAAAWYLKAHGAPEDWRSAIYAYNKPDFYYNDVMGFAAAYQAAANSAPAGTAPTASPTGPTLVPGGDVFKKPISLPTASASAPATSDNSTSDCPAQDMNGTVPGAPSTPEIETVIAYAVAQLGKPYVLNTAGPETFDCSGLTMAAWAQVGVKLDHYTVTQMQQTTPIPAGQEQRGDLIFFVGDQSTSPPPSHVALVVDPVNKIMIEAPQSGVPVRYADYSKRSGIMGFGRPHH